MKLTCLKGKKAGESREFNPPGVFVGREVDNDLQILEDGISQYHAKILFDEGKWVLYDLNSSNGTKVNGNMAWKPIELKSKDVIYFADNAYRFEHEPDKEKSGIKKIEDDDKGPCIRIRSPEESKSSPKPEKDEKKTEDKPSTESSEKLPKGKTPVKTQKEIAEARIMRRLVEKAVSQKKRKLKITMFIIALLVNAAILIYWLHKQGYIKLPQ